MCLCLGFNDAKVRLNEQKTKQKEKKLYVFSNDSTILTPEGISVLKIRLGQGQRYKSYRNNNPSIRKNRFMKIIFYGFLVKYQ